jgi:hypothetical protein
MITFMCSKEALALGDSHFTLMISDVSCVSRRKS